MTKNDQKSNSVRFVSTLVLLIASLGFNFFQYTQYNNDRMSFNAKMDTLYVEKGRLFDDYTSASTDLEKYRGISDSLDKLVVQKQSDLKKRENRIKELQSVVKKDISKRKELEDEVSFYRIEMEQAWDQVDQLVLENMKLRGKNAGLVTQVAVSNMVNKSMEKKVNTASALKVEYIKVSAFKKKLIGDGLSETAMARRASRLEICFTILDNPIAKAGDRIVYIRFIGPDNAVIADKNEGSGIFNRVDNPEETIYTMSTKIAYKNERQDVCATWPDVKQTYKEGIYTAEIYIDNQLVSSNKFSLK